MPVIVFLCMLAHRPGDTALCLPRWDGAVCFCETGDGFRGQPGSTFPSQRSLQNDQLLPHETAATAAEPISAVHGSCEKGLVDYIFWEELCGEIGGGWRRWNQRLLRRRC